MEILAYQNLLFLPFTAYHHMRARSHNEALPSQQTEKHRVS